MTIMWLLRFFSSFSLINVFIADDIQLIVWRLRSLTKRVDKLSQMLLFPKILLFLIQVFLIFTFERDFKLRMAPFIRLRCLLSYLLVLLFYTLHWLVMAFDLMPQI